MQHGHQVALHVGQFALGDADFVAALTGDDVLDALDPAQKVLETGEPLSSIGALFSANAYLGVEAMLPALGTLDDPSVLAAIPNHYRSGCREHCALWTHCRDQAVAASQPILLGEDASEYLAAAGSLGRAVELMHGTGLPPRNAAEQALAAELLGANQLFRRTLG